MISAEVKVGISAKTVRDKLFLSSKVSVPALGHTQPAIQWLPASFFGSKADGEVRQSPPSASSIADVKNEWSYTSSPLYTFLACTGTTLSLI